MTLHPLIGFLLAYAIMAVAALHAVIAPVAETIWKVAP